MEAKYWSYKKMYQIVCGGLHENWGHNYVVFSPVLHRKLDGFVLD